MPTVKLAELFFTGEGVGEGRDEGGVGDEGLPQGGRGDGAGGREVGGVQLARPPRLRL